MASPGAVDDTCTTANENTPLYYNPTTQHYEYLSSTPITYTNPSGMTQVTSAPGAPWQLVPDHFFCVPKQQTSSAAMSQMLQQAASDLASGAHLVQLPQPPPIITAISPGNNGGYNAGTTVTLTGQYFSSAYAVDVGTVSVPFTALSDTVIRFASPSASAAGVPAGGSVNVTVLNPGGTSNAATFTYP
jgi:hypothetical protein